MIFNEILADDRLLELIDELESAIDHQDVAHVKSTKRKLGLMLGEAAYQQILYYRGETDTPLRTILTE